MLVFLQSIACLIRGILSVAIQDAAEPPSEPAFGSFGIVVPSVSVLLMAKCLTAQNNTKPATATTHNNNAIPSDGQQRGFLDYPLLRIIFTSDLPHY